MPVFEWKIPLKVSAADAAAELDRIYDKYNEIDPEKVVEESRPEGAVLHSLFDWDDASAAAKYRVTQARFIIRNIERTEDTNDGPVKVRHIVHTDDRYAPVMVVMSDTELRNRQLEMALEELSEIEAKYHHLKALAAVFDALDEIKKTA